MKYKEIHNMYDMLKGCINRIFITDDCTELNQLYLTSKNYIERIYEYHRSRIISGSKF